MNSTQIIGNVDLKEQLPAVDLLAFQLFRDKLNGQTGRNPETTTVAANEAIRDARIFYRIVTGYAQ